MKSVIVPCLLQLLAIRVDQYNKLPKAEQEKTDAMKYVYQGVQTKVRESGSHVTVINQDLQSGN
jgi:uncharacterized protein YfkK (UPF0435 family)